MHFIHYLKIYFAPFLHMLLLSSSWVYFSIHYMPLFIGNISFLCIIHHFSSIWLCVKCKLLKLSELTNGTWQYYISRFLNKGLHFYWDYFAPKISEVVSSWTWFSSLTHDYQYMSTWKLATALIDTGHNLTPSKINIKQTSQVTNSSSMQSG